MAEHKAHVAKYKKDIVTKLTKLIVEYPIVGMLNLENMPTPQLQKMRTTLRDKAVMIMTKKRLISLAFDEGEKNKTGLSELKKYFRFFCVL